MSETVDEQEVILREGVGLKLELTREEPSQKATEEGRELGPSDNAVSLLAALHYSQEQEAEYLLRDLATKVLMGKGREGHRAFWVPLCPLVSLVSPVSPCVPCVSCVPFVPLCRLCPLSLFFSLCPLVSPLFSCVHCAPFVPLCRLCPLCPLVFLMSPVSRVFLLSSCFPCVPCVSCFSLCPLGPLCPLCPLLSPVSPVSPCGLRLYFCTGRCWGAGSTQIPAWFSFCFVLFCFFHRIFTLWLFPVYSYCWPFFYLREIFAVTFF